jgi:hypothetical protein
LGNDITRVPNLGTLVVVERSAPYAESLTFRRIEGSRKVNTEYFTILDGGEDLLLSNYEDGIKSLCNIMTETGLDIGTARNLLPEGSKAAGYMMHTVVCRTSAFNELLLPESGCYHFETMVYTMLARKGIAILNEELYKWIPSRKASKWPDTPFARINGLRWAAGKPPVNVPESATLANGTHFTR